MHTTQEASSSASAARRTCSTSPSSSESQRSRGWSLEAPASTGRSSKSQRSITPDAQNGEVEVRSPSRCRFLEGPQVGVVDPRARSWRAPLSDASTAVAPGDERCRVLSAPCISLATSVRADCASLAIILETVPVSSAAKIPSKRRFAVVPPLPPLTPSRAEEDAVDGVAVLGVPRAPGNCPVRSTPRGASAGQKPLPFFLLLWLLRLPLLMLLLANRGGGSDVAAVVAAEAYSRVYE